MAKRPAFFIQDGKVISKLYSFEWFPGFAVSQKQKSTASLHGAILETDSNANPLEISTKSTNALGVKLSAFHLKLHNYTLENIFQSSKVFENGGPYLDLLDVMPKEAKHDERLQNSGSLKAFRYQNEDFPIIPKTAFYDYIYIAAVRDMYKFDEIKAITTFNYFTDIEFNPAKSINTQARTVSIIKLLIEDYGFLPDFSKEDFIQYHQKHVELSLH